MTDSGSPNTIVLIAIVSALVAFGAAASDVYLPSLPSMAAGLKTSPGLVQQSLTVFLFFFAISQLIYGPLSDRFGRRAVLLFGVAIFLVASVACAYAQSIEALLVFRVIQAFGACSGAVIGRAVVRDLYGPEGSARILAYVAMTMMLTPILAPILGAWLEVTFGWRANFFFIAAFATCVLIAVIAALPETIPTRDRAALKVTHISGNYLTLLSDSRFLGYSLAATFGFCGIWAFITASSFVLIDLVGLSPGRYGVMFALMSCGFAIGSFASARVSQRIGIDRTIVCGIALYVVGAFSLNGFAFAGILTAMTIEVPTIMMSAGHGLILANCQAGAIGPFPRMAGTASAMLGFLIMSGSSLVGALVAALYDGTQFPMVMAALFSAILLVVSFFSLVWFRQADSRQSQG